MKHWWNVRCLMLMVVDMSAWAVVWRYHEMYIKLLYNRLPVWTLLWNIHIKRRGHLKSRFIVFKFNFSQTRLGSETVQWRLHCITVQRVLPSRVRTWSFQLHTTWWKHGTRTAIRPSTWRSLQETNPSSSSYCLKMQTSTVLTMKGILLSTGRLVSWCSVLPPSDHKWRKRSFSCYWEILFKILHKLFTSP